MDAAAIIDEHLPELEPTWRSTVAELIDVILGALPDAQHELKWRQLTFTRNGDWHHWICAIFATKSEVKLIIHKGSSWTIRRERRREAASTDGRSRFDPPTRLTGRWWRRSFARPPTAQTEMLPGESA